MSPEREVSRTLSLISAGLPRMTDAHSRYLICCQIVSRMDLSQVRAVCEWLASLFVRPNARSFQD